MSIKRLSQWTLLALAGGFLFSSSCVDTAAFTAVQTFWTFSASVINAALASNAT